MPLCATQLTPIVGAHFLWRLAYYGDLWPNTYYAKHVRGWPEAGIRYFGAATRNLLAARSVRDLVRASHGLYRPPKRFRNW